MKPYKNEFLAFVFVALVAVLANVMLTGCSALQARNDAAADGVVTPEEAAAIEDAVQADIEELKQTDWKGLGGAALTSAILSFLATNKYRDAKKAKAA